MCASGCQIQVSSNVVRPLAGHIADRYAHGPRRFGLEVLQVKTHYETLENNAKRKRLVRFPDGFSVSFHERGGCQTW